MWPRHLGGEHSWYNNVKSNDHSIIIIILIIIINDIIMQYTDCSIEYHNTASYTVTKYFERCGGWEERRRAKE